MKKRILAFMLILLVVFASAPVTSLAASDISSPKLSSVTAVSTTSIKVKWNKVTDAKGYAIYRQKAKGDYKKIKTITKGDATSFTDKGLSDATLYFYKIQAYNSQQTYSVDSNVKSAYTLKRKFKTNITKLNSSSNTVSLKWKKVKGANGYEIYQKRGSGTYKKIKTITNGSTLSYVARNLSGNTKYSYKIRTYQKKDSNKIFGEFSDVKSVKTDISTPKITVTASSTTAIKVKWGKVSGAKGYVVYQKKEKGTYKKIATITKSSTTSYLSKKLSCSTKYSYKVKAYKVVSGKKVYTDYSKEQTCYTLKKNFKTKISYISSTSNSVSLKWKSVKSASGYEIYQKKTSGEYKKVKTVTKGSTLKATIKSLKSNTKYTYKVRAYKKAGSYKVYGEYSEAKSKKTAKEIFYTVKYNSNGGSAIASQKIKSGNFATIPTIPVKENYKFIGWYTDNGTFKNQFNFTTPIKQDITLYAKWQMVIEGSAYAEESTVSVYSVTSLEVDTDANMVYATVSAPENCALIVRFIEEEDYFSGYFEENKNYIDDGYLYASHIVAAGSNMATITAEVNDSLPDTFVAEAILIDENAAPLCNPYSSIENTERYEEFDEKSVYDFNDDTLVVNFDQDLDNNFGVLADDVMVLTADEVSPQDADGDGEDDQYKIVNPSQAINQHDKIFIYDSDSEHLLKVRSITSKGTYFIVVPTKADDSEYGFDMEDFYKFIKVDIDCNEAETQNSIPQSQKVNQYLASGGSRGINVYNAYENISGSYTLPKLSKEFEIGDYKVSSETNGTISASLVLEWDVVLFGEDYMRCDFIYTTDTSTTFGVSKAVESNDKTLLSVKKDKALKDVKLGKFRIPLGATGITAFVDLKIRLEWEINAGFEATTTTYAVSGFKYNTIDGRQKVDKKDNSWSIQCKGHAEIKLGLVPAVGVEFLEGVLKCSLECFLGAVAEADAVVPVHQEGASKHACSLCIEGKLSLCITVDAKLEYKITEKLTGTPIDIELVNFEKPLFDFYVSLLNDRNSVYGGSISWGKGSCKNMMYKTTVNAQNSSGENINTNVSVYKKSTNTLVQTIPAGNYVYLAPGQYVAKATIEGKACEKSFTVVDASKNVIVSTSNVNSVVNGSVYNVSTNAPISDVTINIYENSDVVTTVTTDGDGNFSLPLDAGTYRIEATKHGYISASQYFVLRDGENKYIEAFKLANDNSVDIMGGIYGAITDAITGRNVSGVEIKIRKNWGNEDGSDIVFATQTDNYGEYDCCKKELFGVNFGLDAGNYTVSISKEGYIPTSFNITIVGGEDLAFNSTITPVGAENVYHIVLTWGHSPSDLDSHLNATYNGSREHVFYGDSVGYVSNLDVDDTSSYGPETVTIEDITKYSGTVMYSVHDFSNSGENYSTELSSSGAIVKVYRGGVILETFYVPAGQTGTVWNVFYIDSDHNIHAVNSFDNVSNPDYVYGSVA